MQGIWILLLVTFRAKSWGFTTGFTHFLKFTQLQFSTLLYVDALYVCYPSIQQPTNQPANRCNFSTLAPLDNNGDGLISDRRGSKMTANLTPDAGVLKWNTLL